MKYRLGEWIPKDTVMERFPIPDLLNPKVFLIVFAIIGMFLSIGLVGTYLVLDKIAASESATAILGRMAINTIDTTLKRYENNTRIIVQNILADPDVLPAISENNPEMIEALTNRSLERSGGKADFVLFYDEEGNRLYGSTPSLPENGEVGEKARKNALTGQVSTQIETNSIYRLALLTAAPVFQSDGTIVAVVIVGYSLANPEFADEMKERSSGEEFAVFLKNECISSTISVNKKRITGITLDENVFLLTPDQQGIFVSTMEILGTNYSVVYKPLFDADNIIVGGIFSGTEISNTLMFIKQVILWIQMVLAFFIATALLLYFRHLKKILETQNQVLAVTVENKTKEITTMQEATIMTMATLAETRDNETGGHIQRTKLYCKMLSAELAKQRKYKDILTPQVVDAIYQSAPLHDIGKIGIPDNILQKPGKFTEEQREIMQQHAEIGGKALSLAEQSFKESGAFLSFAKDIAYFHHEKWDGSGYPRGLSGEDIPLSARIMAIADVYDALTSKRVYKEAFVHEHAVRIIRENAGTHFDPDIVEVFLSLEPDFSQISYLCGETA